MTIANDTAAGLQAIDIDMIDPADDNPRRDFDDLEGLAESMTARGNRVPVTVQAVDGRFRIVAGERRWRAARLAGRPTLNCVVEEYADDADRVEDMVVENAHRRDLNPIEEARSYQQFITAKALTQRDAAGRLAVSPAHMSKALSLLKLPESIQAEVADGRVPVELGYGLSRLADHPDRLDRAWRMPPGARQFYLDRELADLKKTVELDRTRSELEAKHVPVIDWPGNDWEDQDEAPLGGAYFGGISDGVDVKAHESEPCHVVTISPAGVVVPVCTDPTRHPNARLRLRPLPTRQAPPAPPAADEGPQSDINRHDAAEDERRTQEEQRVELNDRRLAWIRTVLAKPKKGAGLPLLIEQLTAENGFAELLPLTAELLTDEIGFDTEDDIRDYVRQAIVDNPDGAAMAMGMAFGEWALRLGLEKRWLDGDEEHQAQTHLAFLAETGFEPAELEKLVSGYNPAAGDDGPADGPAD